MKHLSRYSRHPSSQNGQIETFSPGASIKVGDRYLLKVDHAISRQQSLAFYAEFTELGSDRVLVNINTPIKHLHPTLFFSFLGYFGFRLMLILTSGAGIDVPIS